MAARNKASVYLSDRDFERIEKMQNMMHAANPHLDCPNVSQVVRAGVNVLWAQMTATPEPETKP